MGAHRSDPQAALFELAPVPTFDARSGAALSPCRRYRYWLTRTWATDRPELCWVLLNSSRADASDDDPTVRRMTGFSKRWGFGGIIVVNLFAYRTPYPEELLRVDDPVGPRNDDAIAGAVDGRRVLVAWGGCERFAAERIRAVLAMLEGRELECLGTTKSGQPLHPVRLPNALSPVPYTAPKESGS